MYILSGGFGVSVVPYHQFPQSISISFNILHIVTVKKQQPIMLRTTLGLLFSQFGTIHTMCILLCCACKSTTQDCPAVKIYILYKEKFWGEKKTTTIEQFKIERTLGERGWSFTLLLHPLPV